MTEPILVKSVFHGKTLADVRSQAAAERRTARNNGYETDSERSSQDAEGHVLVVIYRRGPQKHRPPTAWFAGRLPPVNPPWNYVAPVTVFLGGLALVPYGTDPGVSLLIVGAVSMIAAAILNRRIPIESTAPLFVRILAYVGFGVSVAAVVLSALSGGR